MTTAKAAERAIEQVRKELGLDRRSSVFEVHAVARNGSVTVLGHATDESAIAEVVLRLQGLRGVGEVIDEVIRLPGRLDENEQHALVRAPIAPVYEEPRLPAPLITQLVLGSRVDLLSRENAWWRVRGEDGYIGWVHSGYLQTGSQEWARAWERRELGEPVVSLGAELIDEEARVFSRLPWGSRLMRVSHELYGLADGRSGFIGSGEIVPVDRLFDRFPPRGDSVTRTARRWLGAPYLWGGVTLSGVDCSGLTQAVFWMHGVALPRDSDMQARVGVPIDVSPDFEVLKPGDLLYFSEARGRVSHVAVSLGGSAIIHASLTNGSVAINDLLGPGDFERRLRGVFTSARRLLPDV
jgi:hypothetical protein